MELIKLKISYYNELMDAVAQCEKLTNKNASLRGLILEQNELLKNVYTLLSVKKVDLDDLKIKLDKFDKELNLINDFYGED